MIKARTRLILSSNNSVIKAIKGQPSATKKMPFEQCFAGGVMVALTFVCLLGSDKSTKKHKKLSGTF